MPKVGIPATVAAAATTGVAKGMARVSTPIAGRKPSFTAGIAKDPEDMAQQVTTLQRAVQDMTQSARSGPFAQCVTFRNITVPTNGTVAIRHAMGCPVSWMVIGWRTAVSGSLVGAGPQIEEYMVVPQDGTTITYWSSVQGNADIILFPRSM